MVSALFLSVLAALIFNFLIGFFRKKEKTIDYYDVQKLLYDDGWRKESTSESEYRGYYQFSKGTFVIHSSIKNYVLSNVVPSIHVVKDYGKTMTESDIKNAIETVASMSLTPSV